MKRLDRVLTAIAIGALLALAAVGADDLSQRAKIGNLHPRYVQSCVLGTDELPDECEARWRNALEK